MRKVVYISIALMTVMCISAIAMGGTHHVATLGICVFSLLMALGTRDGDDDMVEF